MPGEKEAKYLLFWRKEAKDFYASAPRQDAGHGLDRGNGGEIKVFGFFSSEKNMLHYK
jgi:hypothetical protein